MEDFHQDATRLVSKGRIKALLSEEGEILYLDIDGSIYEGVGDRVPVPLWRLRRLKLKDIPPNVFIEPVERIQENIIYTLRYSPRLFFDARFSYGNVKVEVTEWAQTWDGYIGFYAYMESLASILEEAEETGFIRDLNVDFSDDSFYISFTIDLPKEMTILRAIKVTKSILQLVDHETEYHAALLALREARKILKRGKQKHYSAFIEKLEKIYKRYEL
ncbi:MAG: hypothetical protein ABWK01_09375 [Infirmifilum sp.]